MWTNRIVGFAEVDPHTIQLNLGNWRTHGLTQQRAITDLLEQVGYVQEVIVNQRTGRLIDGHLRVIQAQAFNEPFIPVKYVELNEDEERKVLALFDPLRGMAFQDAEMLHDLVARLRVSGEGLSALMEHLLEQPAALVPDEMPEVEPSAANTVLMVGETLISITRESYLAWREAMYQAVGFNRRDIIWALAERLGFNAADITL